MPSELADAARLRAAGSRDRRTAREVQGVRALVETVNAPNRQTLPYVHISYSLNPGILAAVIDLVKSS